ncbi:hypothetical protein ACFLT2_05195 [Acidobacteriota bacterium]
MKNRTFHVLILFLVATVVMSSVLLAQQRERPSWDERAPKVGNKAPEVQIYDESLNKISLSNLYKDTLLVIQWGGCT